MTTSGALCFIGRSGASSHGPSPCRRAWRASAFAPHVAQSPEPPFHGKVSCLGRAPPAVVSVSADSQVEGSAAPPGRRCLERQRRATAEGKIKGRGTLWREKAVCTWGWRSTRLEAAACRQGAQRRIGIGEAACFARRTAMALDGGAV